MDLKMKLSSYFFKVHTAKAPTRAGEVARRAGGGQRGSSTHMWDCKASQKGKLSKKYA